MHVANRDRQRVCRVVGSWRFIEAKQQLDHLLHLLLLSAAIPDDRAFDLRRSVFDDGAAGLDGR